jgi:C4-dicarboxylate-specific signal transduction histidine kinase
MVLVQQPGKVHESLLRAIITMDRKQVQLFADKQISLFRDFVAQATTALESTRRERQYREMQSELAHANRVTTMGQLTASITHEINQPIVRLRKLFEGPTRGF